MKVEYPILAGEIAKRGIKKCAIASALKISSRSLYNKMSGVVPFTWPEVCTIKNTFFPDMDKDYLFLRTADDTGDPSNKAS